MNAETSDHAIFLRIEPWIMRIDGISLLEKMLLNYIFSWRIQHKCCFSSDEWLGHKLGFPTQDIFTTLNLLQMKGFIKINRSFQGGARSLTFLFEEEIEDPCEGLTGPDDIFQIND